MVIQVDLLTAADLALLPADGWRYELMRGELRKMPPAGDIHGADTMRLAWRLAQYVETQGLGVVYAAETGFVIATNPDTVLAADVAFVRQEQVAATGWHQGYRVGAPDLAAETISPNDRYTEVTEKVLEWLAAGTRMVIVLDPRKRLVTVYRSLTEVRVLTDKDQLDGGEVVPGWSVAVRDLFV